MTGSATVRLHDSVKEVGDLSRLFLLEFSDSNGIYTPVNGDACAGRGPVTVVASGFSRTRDSRSVRL